jgi:adenylate cyclase
VDELVRQTLEIAIDVLDADAGSLLLHNTKDDTLVFRYVVGAAATSLTGFAMPSSQGIAGRVFNSGEPDLTQKVSESAEFNRTVDEKTGYHTESMMTVPVKRSESMPIGVMQVLNARELFDERDLEVLEV